jgi:hypothetical protein
LLPLQAYPNNASDAGVASVSSPFGEITSDKPNYGKLALVAIIWLFLNISSALGIYLVMSALPSTHTCIGTVRLTVRVTAIALCNLGCSAILMFRGHSMHKHIESIRKRATAIGELADAQRQIAVRYRGAFHQLSVV